MWRLAASLSLAVLLTACSSARRSNVATPDANACAGIEFPAELWTDDIQAQVRAGLTGFHKPTNDPELDAERATRVDRVLASLNRAATHWTELRQQACTNEALTEAERTQVDACLLANLAWRATIVEVAQSPPPETVIGRIEPNVMAMDLDAELCLYKANFSAYEPRTAKTAVARDAIAEARAHRLFEFHFLAQQAAQQAVEAASGESVLAEALLELGWAMEATDRDATELLARESLGEAERAKHELGVMGARHLMARVAYRRSQYDVAIAIYQELAPEYQRLLGSERPEYAGCLNDLGLAYAGAGELDRARTSLFNASKQMEAVLGKTDPNTATTYDSLGYILHQQGEFELALLYYERALEVRRRILGSDHPDTATGWHDVGVALDILGNSEEALPMLEHALRLRQRVLGEDHLETAATYFSLGEAQLNSTQLDASLQSFTRAEAIFRNGESPIDAANATEYIGLVYFTGARYDEAFAAYEQVLAIRTRELGANHPDTGNAHVGKAEVLYRKGDLSGSLACYRTALAIYEAAEVRDEESIALIRSWIAELCPQVPNCRLR